MFYKSAFSRSRKAPELMPVRHTVDLHVWSSSKNSTHLSFVSTRVAHETPSNISRNTGVQEVLLSANEFENHFPNLEEVEGVAARHVPLLQFS